MLEPWWILRWSVRLAIAVTEADMRRPARLVESGPVVVDRATKDATGWKPSRRPSRTWLIIPPIEWPPKTAPSTSSASSTSRRSSA